MPASATSTPPPPPPPDNETELRVAPPPPPPPPPAADPSNSKPPPPPTSELEEPTKSKDQPAKATEATEADPKPRRKSRFAPIAQDQPQPQPPCVNVSLSTSHPQQGNTETQSASSSSSLPTRESSSRLTTSAAPLSANQWEKTAFVGDASGEKRMKFLKLMGLGKSSKIESKPDNTEEASQEAAKRQQVLRDMERQYETGRKRRHQLN
ncbi:hypothetical protein BGZ93_005658 [Podila epicladia]|nr:hypothetical protein BGZ92_008667 [Podila epicladia]KAG0095623.1 hypothetical protein BGZ93_005658 [Podila epicladia]